MTAVAALVALGLLAGMVVPRAPAQQDVAKGESIYLRGVLPSGAPLEGEREAGLVASGPDAACVNCHQRSGLGMIEGTAVIPPIAGDFLFRPRVQQPGDQPLPFISSAQNRDPYTDETLARAVREGLNSQGRTLSLLMPRYHLGDEEMASLISYLRSLETTRAPGMSDTEIQLATVVTPDADPVRRRGMLEVLTRFVAQQNRFPLKPSPKMLTSARTQYVKEMYIANKRWKLRVWELTGPASSWKEQLERKQAEEPVYALLSGLGGDNWAPVHEFCEQSHVPCLFPNVEVPVVADRDFFSLYFSQGVLLEAKLIAQDLVDKARPAAEVEQIYRVGDSGEAGARALSEALVGSGIPVRMTTLPRGAGASDLRHLRVILRKASARDGRGKALVVWLRPGDLEALDGAEPGEGQVFVSGLLAGLERAPLSAAWRSKLRMPYIFDLPMKRKARLNYPLGWFATQHIEVVAEQVQTDTYLACSLLAEALNRVQDNASRAYLVEDLQQRLEHRLITGYYPRLSLGPNQRFASKGGFVVRLAGGDVVPDGNWSTP